MGDRCGASPRLQVRPLPFLFHSDGEQQSLGPTGGGKLPSTAGSQDAPASAWPSSERAFCQEPVLPSGSSSWQALKAPSSLFKKREISRPDLQLAFLFIKKKKLVIMVYSFTLILKFRDPLRKLEEIWLNELSIFILVSVLIRNTLIICGSQVFGYRPTIWPS